MIGILPEFGPDTAEFWAYAQRKELRMQKCTNCGKFRWPPSPRCPACWSPASEWTLLSGHGLMRSWVTYRRQYYPEFPIPYSVALVELDEGPRYQALLVNCDTESLRYEMRLSVTFVQVEERDGSGKTMLLPMFQPG